MKTILITGCSSGFGLATAQYFLARDWRVIATMRTPREDLFAPHPHLQVLALDVTDAASIAAAVAAAGPIDVLVNNAGIGLLGAVEGTPMAMVQEVFATNTFGTIAMVQAVLPQMRERRAGVIINVTSSVTLLPLPLLAVYTASKAAVNALTESMALELQQFNVRTHLVLPGRAPATSFGAKARPRIEHTIPPAYAALAADVFDQWKMSTEPVTDAADVAEAVWRTANDASAPMRVPAGADAVALAAP
ncbi:MAG TPA: SDR family oxidoreductase [Telluria sp.]|nr:SDR family oxidoreductase [Telluria sp.]